MFRGRHATGVRRLRGALLIICACALAGCAAFPHLKLKEIASGKSKRILPSVPFFAQTRYQCGPAALAGLLGATGLEISPETLTPQVFLPKRRGSLQIELLAAARRAGRVAYVIASEPQALVAEIEAGRPVLVLQNLRTQLFPIWHYSVLVGFDPDANRMYLNSGTRKELKMGARSFLRTWNWAGRWAMVALRPGELPATGDPQRYAQAVASFQQVAGSEAALPAWQAAVRQWPRDSRAYLALGNIAYDNKDLAAAVHNYRRGLALNPHEPGLNNNLASVLGALGCPRAGEVQLRAIAAELASDSIWKAPIDGTLAELASKPGKDPGFCGEFAK